MAGLEEGTQSTNSKRDSTNIFETTRQGWDDLVIILIAVRRMKKTMYAQWRWTRWMVPLAEDERPVMSCAACAHEVRQDKRDHTSMISSSGRDKGTTSKL